ncbi:hypothetical protein TRFO_12166 [Tritrichomonas foetus]|uniref:Uncharacterized protein n=1 Tax=Tritrichomonas foetus TaxID=1144522 RepID=A0A1J4J055_9EUKA|nr:hypothetical protein TRFO_12166 [Tritrichomonas foetus]|eukprot:OHS92976.1 hypothetical protein TRFO_12166 [Tritrichomonas foetus]
MHLIHNRSGEFLTIDKCQYFLDLTFMLETKRKPSPDELICEWVQWETPPELQFIKVEETLKMKPIPEFNDLIAYLKKTKQALSSHDISKIQEVRCKFLCFIEKTGIGDSQKLFLSLHNLHKLCLWKENKQEILKILENIVEILKSIESGKYYKENKSSPRTNSNPTTNFYDNPQGNSNYQNTSTYHGNSYYRKPEKSHLSNKNDDIIHNIEKRLIFHNSSDEPNNYTRETVKLNGFGNSQKLSAYSLSSTLNRTSNNVQNKINLHRNKKYENQFGSLAGNQNSSNSFEFDLLQFSTTKAQGHSESTEQTTPIVKSQEASKLGTNSKTYSNNVMSEELQKHFIDLQNILQKQKNGVIDRFTFNKITKLLEAIAQSRNSERFNVDVNWRDEVAYFKHRNLIPLQHIVSLRQKCEKIMSTIY